MGFVAKDSTEIVIDAVLTDIGRQKLAKNDNSFKVVSFIFADDEIDYGLFNPTTGSSYVDQEILNMPIFEANVNEKLSVNFPLITITRPDLKYLPSLASDATSLTIGEEKAQSSGVSVRFYQNTNQNAKIVPIEIQDPGFKIELANDLLYIENNSAVEISPYGTAMYIIQRDDNLIQSSGGSQVTFKIRPQSLNSTTWNTFGIGTAPSRTISTKIKATGINSGLSTTITIVINEEFIRTW